MFSWDTMATAVATSASVLICWCLLLTLSYSCQTSWQHLRIAVATFISLKNKYVIAPITACNDLKWTPSINLLVLGKSLMYQVLVHYILVPPIEPMVKWQIEVDVCFNTQMVRDLLIVWLHLLVSSPWTAPRCRAPSSLGTTKSFY